MIILETVEILPAVVIGFEIDDDKKLRELTGLPSWLFIIEQQAGGLCMTHPSVLGMVLRLGVNVDKGKPGLAEVLRAMEAMAEDPDMDILHTDFPYLVELVKTWGTDYDYTELKCLHEFISTGLNLPEFESGLEAFLRCAPGDPMAFFSGWRVLTCYLKPELQAEYPPAIYLWDSLTDPDFICDDNLVFNENIIKALIGYGEELTGQSKPQIFLLWQNSD